MNSKPYNQLSKTSGVTGSRNDIAWWKTAVPCQAACPANTNIPEYLEAIAADDLKRAYMINLKDNVFPGVLGRVCSRPCEPVCRHGVEGNGDSVSICFSKRSAADFIDASPSILKPLSAETYKTIAVIGSGVAGFAGAGSRFRGRGGGLSWRCRSISSWTSSSS